MAVTHLLIYSLPTKLLMTVGDESIYICNKY